MKTLIFVLLCVLSGALYHVGGCGADGVKMYPRLPKWLWGKINGKIRDIGCSLCTVFALWLFYGWSWWYLAVFFLSWGALSTYWKGDKPDCKWYHWFAHGTAVGLALLPLVFATNRPYCMLYKILLRSVALGGIMMIVSEGSESVVFEETGRGASILVSLPILFM